MEIKTKRINKEEAVKTLYALCSCRILGEEISLDLEDIMQCLQDSIDFGIDTFGMEEEKLEPLYSDDTIESEDEIESTKGD